MKIKIVEVGARDGLQNETQMIPTLLKVDFINRLSETGLQTIEATSFVSAKKIPQLSDHSEVYAAILKKPGVDYPVLVPNLQGLENALAVEANSIAIFASASEAFSQKNIHCSIEESFKRYEAVCEIANAKKLKIRGYLSCVLGCPYEGAVSPKKVAQLAERLYRLGCYEISLGDTIGVGTPKKAQALIETVSVAIAREKIAVHFHDTYGQALANIFACLEKGIGTVDSSIAGLGGCPYAKGASGNVATEDVLYLLNGMGLETGVSLEKILEVSRFISEVLQRKPVSKVAQALRHD